MCLSRDESQQIWCVEKHVSSHLWLRLNLVTRERIVFSCCCPCPLAMLLLLALALWGWSGLGFISLLSFELSLVYKQLSCSETSVVAFGGNSLKHQFFHYRSFRNMQRVSVYFSSGSVNSSSEYLGGTVSDDTSSWCHGSSRVGGGTPLSF